MRRCKLQEGFSFKCQTRMDATVFRPFSSRGCEFTAQNSILPELASLEAFGTRSSFPAMFVWYFTQAGIYLNQTAELSCFCVCRTFAGFVCEQRKQLA